MRKESLTFEQLDLPPWHVEYLVFGHGPETLLAFHGFDNDAEDLLVFEPSLGDRFTIISINLFFHGKSRSTVAADRAVFDTQALSTVVHHILTACDVHRFSLLGYSLGGRICLKTLELFPDRIDRLLLLAADGLKMNRWYIFITGTKIGRSLFRRVVKKPDTFLRMAGIIRALRLVGEKQYKFALSYFDDQKKRDKVYAVWMIYRLLLPDQKSISSILRTYPIACHLLFGKRDSIIPAAFGNSFLKKVGGNCTIHCVDAGHQLIKPSIGEYLRTNCLQ